MTIKNIKFKAHSATITVYNKDNIECDIDHVDLDEIIGEIEAEESTEAILSCFAESDIISFLRERGYKVEDDEFDEKPTEAGDEMR